MSAQSKAEARKEQILAAAEKTFAQKGFHESTIAEIAKVAGVSEGTIYEYFSTKEGLLFSIPEAFTKKMRRWLKFNLQLIRGASHKLRAIVYLHLNIYQENPDYAQITLLILKGNLNFRKTEGYRLVRESFQTTTQVIEEGMASGEFRSDINPYLVRSVLMGAVDHLAVNWLYSDRKYQLLDAVDPVLDLVMEGLLSQEPPQGERHPSWDAWRPRPPAGPMQKS